ncbi:hypothetical protein PoB_005141500, partial [Plakobranchus ocellatus]
NSKPEPSPPAVVDMPEVEESVKPARRPSLLRDSDKKAFKNVLKPKMGCTSVLLPQLGSL